VSYGTLEASFRKQQRGFQRDKVLIKEQSPMHTFQWYRCVQSRGIRVVPVMLIQGSHVRIILDEAHNIKERSTNAAKAAFALDGKYKWCLSGTPLQNRVGELYSLIRFLGGDRE
jgi:DNA repair protein RAD16